MRISHRILRHTKVKAFAKTYDSLLKFFTVTALGAVMTCFTIHARASHEIEALRAYQACAPWGDCDMPLPGASALEACQNYTVGRVLGRFNPPLYDITGTPVYACNAPSVFNASGECHPAYCGAYAIVAWAPYCPTGYSLYRFDVGINWYICLRPGPHEELRYQVRLSPLVGVAESATTLVSVEPGKTTESLVAKVYDNNGQLVPNAKVKLVVDVQPYSGGHQHDEGRHSNSVNENRVGKLAPVSPSTGTVTENGKILSGTTGSNGLRFTFKAPASAGDHKITASCTDGKNCTPEGSDTVWVGVKDLIELPGLDVYVLIPNMNDPKHPDNHYMTYTAMLRVMVLAALYHGQFPDDPLLHLNDASLERGGLFDYKAKDGAAWKPPHETHREGIHIDIRANPNINPDTAIPLKNFNDFVEISKKAGGIARLHNVGTSTQHYHVRF